MSDYAINAQNVTVKYGNFSALRDLTFTAETGKIIGLLGPNGAGKSTFVDAVIGARKVSDGSIRTLGVDPIGDAAKLRPDVGIVLQSAGFPTGMKVKDILFSWRRYVPEMTKKDVLDIVERVNLKYLLDRPLSSLSGGERRRVDIAIALYGNPKLIVLDEPTTGLDPVSRENVWGIIRSQRDLGATVLLTTHYLDEVEALSDSVSVIKQGHITVSGTVDELAASVPAPRASSVAASQDVLDGLADCLPQHGDGASRKDGRLEWQSHDPARDLEAIYRTCADHGWQIADVCVEKPSLRAAYSALVGTEKSKNNIPATKDDKR
ncbi:ABC transporter ATP-binding protein [Bifidobacterium sp. ESL0682]|uniref:ABC transporter ATP-binding protein n=1 Tax=Bifidobacterium sp. ESL0682 TaxID=2983212 RepID=UPI0023F7B1B6|nr:ABC transporter ATP-binding protein [Bifidobacterium sp. ESL0682]WEV41508.1 ABC transporter ATP-binding protein [Bifidobacterium sp. ESL0682]